MTFEEALHLEERITLKLASPIEIRRVMDAMLRFAAPEIPEYSADLSVYSTVEQLKRRLFEEGKASIIATNPPMASGFLANQVLFHLLQKSTVKRSFVLCPDMPGYLMFDAAHMITEVKKFDTAW